MKIAVITGFLTKGNVDVDAGHPAKIRYKNDLCTEDNFFIQRRGGGAQIKP